MHKAHSRIVRNMTLKMRRSWIAISQRRRSRSSKENVPSPKGELRILGHRHLDLCASRPRGRWIKVRIRRIRRIAKVLPKSRTLQKSRTLPKRTIAIMVQVSPKRSRD